ncbi:MAG: alcohol dehydrogenase catalytic domain-containing protein [Kiritimatiellae bacterium]|nr:alcohol dehydrogenase catalytic domain-containing protein [Kiritimatiellia bacterium]MDD5523258.1 alcohol dehydrogenase catalytic domain-containing protein [Kiritimatiellia bacterium]
MENTKTGTMRAVVYHAPGDIRKEQVPMPACGKGEILVKIDACAVCGTDLKAFVSGNPRILVPKVMGHEFTGTIEETGQKVKAGFRKGDRIVMATSISCGKCYYCRRGWNNLCADIKPMGFSYEGGMAEYVVIPERAINNGHLINVTGKVKPEFAALAEPLSCAVNSIENCGVKKGDMVVVVGAGPMGIMNGCVAREFGAKKIIMAEVNKDRLKQCDAFGFDLLVDPANEDLVRIVKDQTGGLGADVVIVAAPAALPQEQALSLVRKRGSVCLFASLPAGKSLLSVDSRLIHYGELKVVGTSDSTPAQVKKAVKLISGGSIPVKKLVTHVLDLFEFGKAFELMKSGESLRVVLVP